MDSLHSIHCCISQAVEVPEAEEVPEAMVGVPVAMAAVGAEALEAVRLVAATG